MEFKVIIAGGRDFNNYDLLAQTMDELNIIIFEFHYIFQH